MPDGGNNMIRLVIDGFPLLLPSKWEELKQEDACKILEIRQMHLKKNVFYWQVLKLLLNMPSGKWYSLLYFLIKWKWLSNLLMQNKKELLAKWKLITKSPEDLQLDLIRFLSFVEEKPVFKSAPIMFENLSDFQSMFQAKAWVQIPDTEGKLFNFEQLVDAILYFTQYSKNETINDLDKLIAVIYFRVDGHYNPVYMEYFTKLVEKKK